MSEGPLNMDAERLAEWAASRSMPMHSWSGPGWPEGDPRWDLTSRINEASPWWAEYEIDTHVVAIADEAKRELRRRRVRVIQGALEAGDITRAHVVSALGMTFAELDRELEEFGG